METNRSDCLRMRWFSIPAAIIVLMLSGCSNQTLYEPSEFAENIDPGRVVESFLGVMWNEQPEVQNKTFGLTATYTEHSYMKVFHFEPEGQTNDPARIAAKLKESVTGELRSEGFELDDQSDKQNDVSILYHSKHKSGSVNIFTTATVRGVRVIGVVHEHPKSNKLNF